ncbi:hypothetical protein RM572_06695 [Streptomyces sp. DSM 42041]|uniref:AMIN-like domain-containing protein n=1 Tax=Streptomyces hazeniae TaxID=3075538 RepID=A0ABU2NR27_9ACTN|nr:hypothetical protein [Streptomyces sp. DSM 42041]MDT0378467.1 hypothetical protein [Streptomyces sp. DSM 42041]
MKRRPALVAFAVASALLTSGCGQGTVEDGSGRSTPGGEAAPSAGKSSAPPSAAPADVTPRTVEAREQGDAGGAAKLSSVKVTRLPAYDRVRFTFDGGVSQVFAEYMDALREPGRGRTIDLKGEHKLVLVFVGVARQDPAGRADTTDTVREVRATGVFEGEMIVGLGLDSEGEGPAGYRVEVKGDSVTVEVAHRASPSGSPSGSPSASSSAG